MLKRIVLWILVFVCGIGTASAVTFEVTPFVGTRTTGEFDDIDSTEIHIGGVRYVRLQRPARPETAGPRGLGPHQRGRRGLL
jgi:hypothetical protein